MFGIETVTPTPGKMEARKEVRMHRRDEERIRAAAAATGLQEADFIRQAALLRAQEVEQRMALSVLCLLYTSPSPRDLSTSRMPSSA